MNAGPEPGAVDIPTGDNARMTTHDNSVAGSALGRHVDYPQGYDPDLLYPIARTLGRHAIGLRDAALPFIGHDRWHAYELSWLDAKGKPQVATATFEVPADAPNLIESKSLKLYLNSFNATRFASDDEVVARMVAALSATWLSRSSAFPRSARCAARVPTVGKRNKYVIVSSGAMLALRSRCSCTARSEWPPIAKKLSFSPTRSRPSVRRYASARSRSSVFSGATKISFAKGFVVTSGFGSALRSTLAFGVIGKASRTTKWAGTI